MRFLPPQAAGGAGRLVPRRRPDRRPVAQRVVRAGRAGGAGLRHAGGRGRGRRAGHRRRRRRVRRARRRSRPAATRPRAAGLLRDPAALSRLSRGAVAHARDVRLGQRPRPAARGLPEAVHERDGRGSRATVGRDSVSASDAGAGAADEVLARSLVEPDLEHERADRGRVRGDAARRAQAQDHVSLIVGEHACGRGVRRAPARREPRGGLPLAAERNARLYGVAFAIDQLGDVYLTGRLPLYAGHAGRARPAAGRRADVRPTSRSTRCWRSASGSIRGVGLAGRGASRPATSQAFAHLGRRRPPHEPTRAQTTHYCVITARLGDHPLRTVSGPGLVDVRGHATASVAWAAVTLGRELGEPALDRLGPRGRMPDGRRRRETRPHAAQQHRAAPWPYTRCRRQSAPPSRRAAEREAERRPGSGRASRPATGRRPRPVRWRRPMHLADRPDARPSRRTPATVDAQRRRAEAERRRRRCSTASTVRRRTRCSQRVSGTVTEHDEQSVEGDHRRRTAPG